MLGLGSSLVHLSRLHSEIVTLYEQESFTDIGDWRIISLIGNNDVSDSTVTAGQTAPESSNNDWLKFYFAEDYNASSYDAILEYNQQIIADLGAIAGDHLKFSAEVYLDGTWGTDSEGYRQMIFGAGEAFIFSQLLVPTGQEVIVSMPSSSSFPVTTLDGTIRLNFSGAIGVIKSGSTIYMRNIKITTERY